MPIVTPYPVRRMTQDQFGQVSFEVMEHVFAIHADYGRFFDEAIYKRELLRRIPRVKLEYPVDVIFGDFSKRYLLDVFVDDGAPFEFKATDRLNDKHRSQLLNYLLLTDLAHGRLITTRPESVKYEFVNTTLRSDFRRRFSLHDKAWNNLVPGASDFRDLLISLLQDWGTGLDLSLYEEAATHFLGGESNVHHRLEIKAGEVPIGSQVLRLAAPNVAFKITSLGAAKFKSFAEHTRRFKAHTSLKAILWVNITNGQVIFTTIQ